MKLEDTIDLMKSDDYKDRFKAEYYQLTIRYQKLFDMCIKYKAGTLGFKPRCTLELLEEQLRAMGKLIMLLDVRAEIEGIVL
jgi:hypothetical protein